ncbi:hypothetical protein DL93DRAFT_1149641 [Clavulina sp. PMI_390]|nr:hypothetical protein DL93DRAFT_1149641 [Clavulina sp. PMI_390]
MLSRSSDSTSRSSNAPCHINDLPGELLATIFLLATEPPSAELAPHIIVALRALWKTCHSWYLIVMGDPLLWSSIYIDVYAPNGVLSGGVFLLRSRDAMIDLYIKTSPAPKIYDEFSEAIESLKETLSPHWHRIRSLQFQGDTTLFPLPIATPRLKTFSWRQPHPSRPTLRSIFNPESLVPIHSISVELSMFDQGKLDPFKGIDPRTLHHVRIKTLPWSMEAGSLRIKSLSNFRNLRSLHIGKALFVGYDPQLAYPHPLDFPLLESLSLHEPCNVLGRMFSTLPCLIHLSITGRSVVPSRHDGVFVHSRFGVDSPSHNSYAAWPILPKLKTMTVDHVNMEDFVPTLQTSSELVALHLHGFGGFSGLLRELLHPATAPSLLLLRLFARALPPPEILSFAGLADADLFGTPDAAGDIIALLDHILGERKQLRAEIAPWARDTPHSFAVARFPGQWEWDHLAVCHSMTNAARLSSATIDEGQGLEGSPRLSEIEFYTTV